MYLYIIKITYSFPALNIYIFVVTFTPLNIHVVEARCTHDPPEKIMCGVIELCTCPRRIQNKVSVDEFAEAQGGFNQFKTANILLTRS